MKTPIRHFNFKNAEVMRNTENIVNYTISKIYAEVVNFQEETICNAIIKEAQKEGISDLFLIDKEFVITALKKQIPKRTKHSNGAWRICPTCYGSIPCNIEEAANHETSYCFHCGQALKWGVKEK